MKKNSSLFTFHSSLCSLREQRGGMLVEMLLTIALGAVMLPFLINFQRDRITRAENIAITKQMETISGALERYMDINKKELFIPMGKNITRIKIANLEEYGLPSDLIKKYGDEIQLRVIKSRDVAGHAQLQGVILYNAKDISALRTREIINFGGDRMGFAEGGRAYGAFGTWHAGAGEIGLGEQTGIVEKTKTKIGSEQYLWRTPSANESDATMLSGLDLGGHNITNAKFMDANSGTFNEVIKSETFVADKIVFGGRTTLDKNINISDATVTGTLTSDSKNMEVAGTLNLEDSARLNGFTTDNLWATNLRLSGLSIQSATGYANIKVSQAIDMVAGHINAMTVNVGFTGSITPKLVVKSRIEDSTDTNYYWDISSQTAQFSDASFVELNRMATLASRGAASTTESARIFGMVAANKNATAADFMNAVTEIQKRVRAKYRMLNLE